MQGDDRQTTRATTYKDLSFLQFASLVWYPTPIDPVLKIIANRMINENQKYAHVYYEFLLNHVTQCRTYA